MEANVYAFGQRDDAINRQEIVDTLKRLLDGNDDLKTFPTNFKLALQKRVWEHDRKSASGKVLTPVSFHDFVHEHYPIGIGASYEIVENLIRGRTDVLAIWTEVTKRLPGDGQERDSATGRMLPNVDNIHEREERPSGTSAAAGLRKLQKAAGEGNEDAAAQLAEAVEGRKSVHAACVDSGLRKSTKIDRDVRDRAARSLAERIVANFPPDELDTARADAFSSGAKALGIELANLVGSSIMDRRHG